MSSYISRKIQERGSALFRAFVFPFIKFKTELSTSGVIKQGAYFNKGTVLGGRNYLGRECYLTHVELGYGSYLAEHGRLIDTSVGKYCSLGPYLRCAFGLHPAKGYPSTHPAFYSTSGAEGFTYADKDSFCEERFADEKRGMKVVIGNNVWIGACVTLTEGIKIGDGAVVAAGSLVKDDLEPYTIYAGVPAKKIGERFTEEQRKALSERGLENWWEKSSAELEKLVKEGRFTAL